LSPMRKRSSPGPLRDAPPLIEIHGVSEVAVHAHDACAVTVVESSYGTDMHALIVTGATWNSHSVAGGSPCCVIENTASATWIVPDRASAEVFREMLYARAPSPAPSAPEVTVIHASAVEACQLHAAEADTAKVPFAASLL
jgi:hypothetical protein